MLALLHNLILAPAVPEGVRPSPPLLCLAGFLSAAEDLRSFEISAARVFVEFPSPSTKLAVSGELGIVRHSLFVSLRAHGRDGRFPPPSSSCGLCNSTAAATRVCSFSQCSVLPSVEQRRRRRQEELKCFLIGCQLVIYTTHTALYAVSLLLGSGPS
ncbi:hypothetical protein E2C01_020475 [Portunus trituberculatus]|uniref:Uncharacterized protein n=1 Tax=Portunus trituberculatus TaxID=210409 RepID=A0A5B7E1T2_PORTR|nr:hypothetical protein [Portunus trituberculatus]